MPVTVAAPIPTTFPAGQWHHLPAETCLDLWNTSLDGLSAEHARTRLAVHGPNALPESKGLNVPLLFLRQFKSPLIYLLLAAAAVSLIVGELTDAGFIAAVLLINAIIGSFQEYHAEASAAALQKLIRHSARVRRDGLMILVEARDLVPGDIVDVESGVAVPADIRLVVAHGLMVDESTFSGESLPVSKNPAAKIPRQSGLGDRPTMLHAGTTIAEGRATGVVVATGSATALGSIEASLRASAAPPPPLLLRLHYLARQIAAAAVLAIAVLGAILVSQGEPVDEVLLLAVALAVSAIPEGLPVAVTVALSAATRRMARRNVIVRSLPAVEGLGSCTLIASDKTGTLTLNRLSVERVLLPSGEIIERQSSQGSNRRLAQAVAICNEAAVSPDGGVIGDTVDVALMEFARAAGIDIAQAFSKPRVSQLAYEPARRFAAVAVEGALYVKGAPETVLPMCEPVMEAVPEGVESLASAGYRVLAIAGRAIMPEETVDCANPQGLELLGIVALLDPLRPEVPEAIARCAEAGVKVKMVTGDHPSTARTIALSLGLACNPEEVVSGADIEALSDFPETLRARITAATVFARIEPSQKLRIVETFSASGETVAVTGDGVNDAPALQAAQVGVAMGQGGTDVARSASDLVLADDNFASIVAGIEEGRVTYANIRKIVIFLLATGVAEVAMFLGAIVFGQPMPLTAVQLLWANLVTNGAQDVMLAFGRGEGDELRQPPRRHDEPIIDRTALALMIPPAVVMAILALVLLDWILQRGYDPDSARNAVLLLIVLFQNVYVISLRSERRPIWREPLMSNPWLILGVSAALLLQMIAMYWPPLASVIGTRPVDIQTLLFCLTGAVMILVTSEATKALVQRRRAKTGFHRKGFLSA